MRSAGCVSRFPGHRFTRVLLAALVAAAPAFAQSPVFAQSPDALERYRQGTEALQAGRVDEARRRFAEAVALDADFPGAWLDLAVATARAGDAAEAEEFLDILESRFKLPASIAETVAALRLRLDDMLARAHHRPPQSAGWRWQRTLQAGGGYDSNANAGLSLGTLTLTLPGGHVVLPVDERFRPHSDTYTLLAAGAAAERPLGQGLLGVNASVRWRRNRVEHDFDTLEWRAGVAFLSAAPLPGEGVYGALPGPWRASASVQQLRLGGDSLQESAIFALEHVWPRAACRPLGSAELDLRTHPVARNLDATYFWLGVTLRCPGLPIPHARALQAQLRLGHAFARRNHGERARPGGDSRQAEFALLHEWGWPRQAGGDYRLQGRVQWERVLDTRGYNPLLADNAVREVTRTALGLAWSTPVAALGEPWQAVFDLQRFRQRSNLGVFDLSGHLLQLSLRRSW